MVEGDYDHSEMIERLKTARASIQAIASKLGSGHTSLSHKAGEFGGGTISDEGAQTQIGIDSEPKE